MSDEVGDCILSRHYDPELMRDVLHVEKADPVAWICDEMLRDLGAPWSNPEWVTLDGDVLTINAANRRVVYVIDRAGYDWQRAAFPMRWPGLDTPRAAFLALIPHM